MSIRQIIAILGYLDGTLATSNRGRVLAWLVRPSTVSSSHFGEWHVGGRWADATAVELREAFRQTSGWHVIHRSLELP